MLRWAIVLAITIAVSSGVPIARAASGNSIPTTPAQLHKIMTTALAAAPAYFAALRGGVQRTVDAGIFFELDPAFAKICPGCSVADEFATAQSDERFTVSGEWPLPKGTTPAQESAYVRKNFAPLVAGYKYTHGKTAAGELWFEWDKGAPDTWMYLVTDNSKTARGIQIRVGHFVAVNANYVKWARLTPDERTDLTNGLTEFVIAGTAAGTTNFASMRGAATDSDNNYFHVNQTFGSVLTGCDIDGIFANESAAEGGPPGKWILECDTPDLGGSKADNLEVIRSAVAGSLPEDFTATTDPKYLGTSAYRWDSVNSDNLSVEIDDYDNGDGTTTFHIYVYHYLR